MSDARIDGYARALFEVARAEGTIDEVEDELFRFARSFESSDELRSALTDDQVPAAKRQAIVEDLETINKLEAGQMVLDLREFEMLGEDVVFDGHHLPRRRLPDLRPLVWLLEDWRA